ncbi:MAG: OB-fold domain-containing protein [Actinobacteria bacterium]|nr:OB-fold domain-containing protein [Actinomycetota bacterium]
MELSAALGVPLSGQRRRFDRVAQRLVGSRCSACHATSWPRRAVCHNCGMPAPAEVRFEPTGVLVTHTKVWIARPGLESPYSVGQIRLVDGPVLFGHVRALPEDASIPLDVRLVFAEDEGEVPPFWFEPSQEHA